MSLNSSFGTRAHAHAAKNALLPQNARCYYRCSGAVAFALALFIKQCCRSFAREHETLHGIMFLVNLPLGQLG
jgi:hypothetical protein